MKKITHDIFLYGIKLLNLLLLTLPFTVCWYGYYADKTAASFYWQSKWVIVALFFVLYTIFSHVYDGLMISLYSVNEIVYSQIISVLLADGILLAVLWLLSPRFPNLIPFCAALLFQILFAVLWAVGAHKWYFSTFPSGRTAIIYDVREGFERLILEYGLDRRFYVQRIASVDECLNDIHMLDHMDTVFLSGVHSHDRNIILKYCIERDISAYMIPRVGDTLMRGAKRMHLFHLPMLRVERYRPSPVYAVCKRLFDIAASAAAIVVLAPVMLITAAVIKAGDGGPALYRQVRLTKDGRSFSMLKFRSMRVDAEQDGVARLSTGDTDERITPVGHFIRKYRVDELPQLFCILSGTMSLVGPRPERPEIAAQYEKEMPEFALRLQVKAGLTGYAQVYGKYNTTPYDKLQMDLMYIAHSGILEDLRIIFATIKILFLPESTEGIEVGTATAMDTQAYNGYPEAEKNGVDRRIGI